MAETKAAPKTGYIILVVDDDPVFLKLVGKVLSNAGHQVFTADDGQEALRQVFQQRPNLVLLDVVMPKMDGYQVCSRIREVSDIPVIMLTGKQTSENDIVRGLDHGADEYLVKPVGNKELLARVNAVLRRFEKAHAGETPENRVYNDDYLQIDLEQRIIKTDGERIRLTPTEFKLFSLLVTNAGRILPHRMLLEQIWGWEYTDDLDYLRIYVLHLRQKIEPEMSQPRYILTEPGVGYLFQKKGAA